ncbi:hypothetical protein DPMN_175187 [Dreissena polymorpha]|uniref:Uncharacterized protein n=1 Tax=Dreissena polymorpha TaxID=45954 RepID=A0A9D4E4R2_DREPO|nr:hypothetical protein DPMN_175187 [Dreissena polymorpha]
MQDTASAMERSCPVYSRFDYDEKLLERVIRNEFALKDTLDKITETNSKVQEMLKQIEKDYAKLNQALHALEEKGRALQDKVGYFLDDGAQNASVTVAEMKTAV